jgi:hypothetical protein
MRSADMLTNHYKLQDSVGSRCRQVGMTAIEPYNAGFG